MKSTIGILIVAMLAAFAVKQAYCMPTHCDSDALDETDNPKIRQLCELLQSYAAAVEHQYRHNGAPSGLIDNGVKRQDVDHVFLRFGRRR